jgi:hypothetical protein
MGAGDVLGQLWGNKSHRDEPIFGESDLR